jgi:hypothetical protein
MPTLLAPWQGHFTDQLGTEPAAPDGFHFGEGRHRVGDQFHEPIYRRGVVAGRLALDEFPDQRRNFRFTPLDMRKYRGTGILACPSSIRIHGCYDSGLLGQAARFEIEHDLPTATRSRFLRWRP